MALVRLYPYSPRQGFVLKSVTLVDEGLRFLGSRGWYEVDEELAEKLAALPQQDRNPAGPKAFMVAKDRSEAKAMDKRLADVLRKQEEDHIGTADEPVPATRPGKRKAATERATVAASEDEEAAEDDAAEEAGPKKRRRRRSS